MNDILANPNLVVLFALVAPLVTSALKNPSWSPGQKQALAWGVSAVFGALAVALRVEAGGIDGLTTNIVVGHIAAVVVASEGVYRLLLDSGGVALKLNERLETLGYGTAAKRELAQAKLDGVLAAVAARNGFTENERAVLGIQPAEPTIGGGS